MDAHSNALVIQSRDGRTDTFSRREELSGEFVKWALMGGHT